MGLFDHHRRAAFKTLTTVMGETDLGVWAPSIGGPSHSHKILLRFPTEEEMIEGITFSPNTYILEWQEPYFPGLFEAVHNDNKDEYLFIGTTKYYMRTVEAIVDGKGYYAIAEKQTT